MSDVMLPAHMLLYAFRHALGRTSHVVAEVSDLLVVHADRLEPDWRRQIVQDIDIAIAEAWAGPPGDVSKWLTVREAMK